MGLFRWSRILDALRLGILLSTVGNTAALGRDCRDGALLAVEELRADYGGALPLVTVLRDLEGVGERYISLARRMVAEDGCRHIVGTVASQARKDVIPVVEKHDATLWYVCPYEGFEANGHVVYTGGCPNQPARPKRCEWVASSRCSVLDPLPSTGTNGPCTMYVSPSGRRRATLSGMPSAV